MNIWTKIIVQLGLIVTGLNFITFMFPSEAIELLGNIKHLENFNLITELISTIVILYFLFQIWRSNIHIKRSKYIWTFYICAFPFFAGTIYLWQKKVT